MHERLNFALFIKQVHSSDYSKSENTMVGKLGQEVSIESKPHYTFLDHNHSIEHYIHPTT